MKRWPEYRGRDLGIRWTPRAVMFRVWAPGADSIDVLLYRRDLGGRPLFSTPMRRAVSGTWTARIPARWKNHYTTYRIQRDGQIREVVDPCARAVGANGQRALIVDLAETDPTGWAMDRRPPFARATDAVIYEMHVRDFTIDPAGGMRHRGKFLALTQRGVHGPGQTATGLDHLVELGVTHVHLLPVFDFAGLDETRVRSGQYNWGYNPRNYNAPGGSYATDPHDGRVRIRELKMAIAALHRAGIRVILDVVYNHTFSGDDSNFGQLVPGYYHRRDRDGGYSNGSGCGNETASERPMFRKFMVESLAYWAREYHVDGFRFDLMGLHDLRTMREIRRALDRVDPSILMYGEGWTGGDSRLAPARRAMKSSVAKLGRIAAFSDTFRDALKGSVFQHGERGFVAGAAGMEEHIKAGVVASTPHPQVRYPSGDAWRGPWAGEPYRCVSYDSCHDNHTLWDRLRAADPRASPQILARMNRLAAAILMTSQGIAFLHAGEEFLRTKRGVENSYCHPDAINRIDWRAKQRHRAIFEYYRGLIRLRRAFPEFRLPTATAIRRQLGFLRTPKGCVAFTLRGARGRVFFVAYNAGRKPVDLALPESGAWGVLVDATRASDTPCAVRRARRVRVAARSAMVLRSGESV